MITFATAGPEHRAPRQVFINFGDNASLDGQGFAPFGQVISGMDVVDALNAEYGEGAPRGRGPDQGRMQSEGNAYLEKDFAGSTTSRRRRSSTEAHPNISEQDIEWQNPKTR